MVIILDFSTDVKGHLQAFYRKQRPDNNCYGSSFPAKNVQPTSRYSSLLAYPHLLLDSQTFLPAATMPIVHDDRLLHTFSSHLFGRLGRVKDLNRAHVPAAGKGKLLPTSHDLWTSYKTSIWFFAAPLLFLDRFFLFSCMSYCKL